MIDADQAKIKILGKKTFRKIVFLPLSLVWDWVYRIRRSFYEYGIFKNVTFKVPVISVGNVTFGGTGKTPTIIWLTEWLSEQGLTPLVLTRGYKGKLENSSGILKSGQKFRLNPFDYGDEPLMISNKMTKGAVVVGKNRVDNLMKYFSEVKPDIVLLDDGFQHLKISRRFNIVLFDATMPLTRYQVAPMGYLREGLSALKDADAIMISRSDMVTQDKLNKLIEKLRANFHHQIPMVLTKYHPIGVFDVHDKYIYSTHELAGRKAIAVTAIASPDSFYQYLEGFGVDIVDKVSFPDHYFFTADDINDLLIKASQEAAIIICSEKDMVKLKRATLDGRILFVKIKVEFISGEKELTQGLSKVLRLDSLAQ